MKLLRKNFTIQYASINFYERAVHAMLGTLSLLALIYCAILLSLVFSVIERKENGVASRDLSSTLSSLEMKYATTVASITENDLLKANFTRVDNATFAIRKDDIASYTVLYAH
jgi:hypothetical protein